MPLVAGDVTLKEAFLHDLASFIVGIAFLSVLACLASLVVLIGWLGAPAPKESPGEIILLISLICGAVLVFLRYRTHRLTEMLNNGDVVTAQVVRGLAFQLFVQIRLQYTRAGEVVLAHLWLPNTKRPRALSRAQRLSLCVPAGRTHGGVIRDLYVPPA